MKLLNPMTAVLAIVLPAAAQYQPVTLFKVPNVNASTRANCYIGSDGTVTGHRLADGDPLERGYALKNGVFELLELVPGSGGMLITGIAGNDPIGVSLAPNTASPRKGVIWRNGIPTLLPTPPVSQPGSYSYFFPDAANYQEWMVGRAVEVTTSGGVIVKPMILRNGTFTPLPAFPLPNAELIAMNVRGDILARALDFSLNPVRYRFYKASLSGYEEFQIPGAYTVAGMDNTGRIAAITDQGDYILYAGGEAKVLPGLLGAGTDLRSLNPKGQSCGLARTYNAIGDQIWFNFIIELR